MFRMWLYIEKYFRVCNWEGGLNKEVIWLILKDLCVENLDNSFIWLREIFESLYKIFDNK